MDEKLKMALTVAGAGLLAFAAYKAATTKGTIMDKAAAAVTSPVEGVTKMAEAVVDMASKATEADVKTAGSVTDKAAETAGDATEKVAKTVSKTAKAAKDVLWEW